MLLLLLIPVGFLGLCAIAACMQASRCDRAVEERRAAEPERPTEALASGAAALKAY